MDSLSSTKCITSSEVMHCVFAFTENDKRKIITWSQLLPPLPFAIRCFYENMSSFVFSSNFSRCNYICHSPWSLHPYVLHQKRTLPLELGPTKHSKELFFGPKTRLGKLQNNSNNFIATTNTFRHILKHFKNVEENLTIWKYQTIVKIEFWSFPWTGI